MHAQVPLPDFSMQDGTPVSGGFDDVYFSRAGGVAETTHVFLEGNQLRACWENQPQTTIGELGFGTGLNFLVAWAAFLREAPASHHLHFLSVEKFPLTPAMLREALAAYPELAPLAEQLLAAYPLRLPGLHRLHFPRVTLTLGFGEAAELLPQFGTPVDAWFLDGFSPAKNPEMWSDAVFAAIGAASRPGTRVATFTSAGFVRRGLQAQGFAIEKVPGYGHKREMTVGVLPGTPPAVAKASSPLLVLGAGIAGATLARALAERGRAVTVLERGAVAGGASGNPAGVLFPQITKRWNISAAWHFAAYSFTLHQLARWRDAGLTCDWQQPGMLRLPRHAEEDAQLRHTNEALGLDAAIAHYLPREEASARAGVPLATGGLWFPAGSAFNPGMLCRALLDHPRITLHTETPVVSLAHAAGQWQATAENGHVYAAPECCITLAQQAAEFLPLRVHGVGGQLSLLDAAQAATPVAPILCQKGYLVPLGARYLTGATYNHNDSLAVTEANHARNLDELGQMLPGWFSGVPVAGRTALRATTPDRLPYVGKLEEGLWVSAGFGSRGLISAPLAAEVIASALCGEAAPVAAALRTALDPQRGLKR